MKQMTVLDLIGLSLRDINVIAVDDQIPASEANEALIRLNMMLEEWNNDRLMCYQVQTQQATLYPGVGTYDIGLNDVTIQGHGVITDSTYILMQGNFGTLLDGDELGITINGFTATHAVGISETKTQAMNAFAASILTNLSAYGVLNATYYPLTDALTIGPLSGNTVNTWSPSLMNNINGTMLLTEYTKSSVQVTVNGTIFTQVFDTSKFNTLNLLAKQIITKLPELLINCSYNQYTDVMTLQSTKTAPLVVTSIVYLPNQGSGDTFSFITVPFAQNHIDIQRPNRIDSVVVRQNQAGNSVDYNCTRLTNKQFQELTMKFINTTFPYAYLYVPQYPNGQLTLYPLPSGPLSLIFSSMSEINNFQALTDIVSLPPGYLSALHYNLAIEIAAYHNPPDAVFARVLKKAMETKSALKDTNAQEPIYAKIDFAVSGRPGAYPNIFTG